MYTTQEDHTDARATAHGRPDAGELKTAYETVMDRYPTVHWATDRDERTITAYLAGDAEGTDPLVTVCIDRQDRWIACVHAEPNPMTGKVYRLKDGKQTDPAPRSAILALLDVYFSELLATVLRRTAEWVGRTTNDGKDEPDAWDPVTDGPLDRHRQPLARLTMH